MGQTFLSAGETPAKAADSAPRTGMSAPPVQPGGISAPPVQPADCHVSLASPHLFILAVLVFGLSGCHAVDFYHEPLQCPVSPALEPPRERSMVSLPTYRVEPPDILQIEMLKLVPLPPYRIDIYDVLQIRVLGTILDQPIDNFYLVEGEGIVSLGPAYGTVPRGGHDDRGGHRGHHPQVAGGVGQAGRVGAVGPHGRHPADHRPVPDRAGRHDQPAAHTACCTWRARR